MISKRISAIFGSKVAESSSHFRDILHINTIACLFVGRCDVSFGRYALSSEEVARNVLAKNFNFGCVRNVWGQIFPNVYG